MAELHCRIRQARRRSGMSQAEMADATGVHRSAVAQWERRDGSRPKVENLTKLAVLTKTHFEWLATGRGRMYPQGDASDGPDAALVLQLHAHDEVEERVLRAMRKLDYWQSLVIARMVEGFASGKFEADDS